MKLNKEWLSIISTAATGVGILISLVGGWAGSKQANLEMKEEVKKEVAEQIKNVQKP